MTFDSQSSSTTILPPRRPTTLPANTPSEVQRVANRQGGSVEQQVQSAIAQSGGSVIPLNNFSQGVPHTPTMSDPGSQTGTIAVVDDPASAEVNAQVIPFSAMARRRLMGAPVVPTNALAAGPEDSMPFVDDGSMGAAEPAKTNPWPWVIAGGAILAMLWKFSQDSALQGAPLVADLEEEVGEGESEVEPQGSEE
jgi:hypothetical protein